MKILHLIGPSVGTKMPWDAGMRFSHSASALAKVFEDAGFVDVKTWETPVYGKQEIKVEDGEQMWDKTVKNPMFVNFGREGVRDRAKEAFLRMLAGLVERDGEGGVLTQVQTSWMCEGRKPT